MNKVGRNVFKLTKIGHKVCNNLAPEKTSFRENVRSIYCTKKILCKLSDDAFKDVIRTKVPVSFNYKCSCGCNVCFEQTRGDKKLEDFLQEEIKIQIQRQNLTGVPVFEGFELENGRSQVIWRKRFHTEKLTVKVNLNHSKDDDDEELDYEKYEQPSGFSKKLTFNFSIEIEKGRKKLLFLCTSLPPPQDILRYGAAYYINHFGIYEEEFLKSTYLLSEESGLEGYLHELLVFMLEERGINTQFIEKLIQYCTVYEHVLYIDILEKLKNFVSAKPNPV